MGTGPCNKAEFLVFQGINQFGRQTLVRILTLLGLLFILSSCGGGSDGSFNLKNGVFGPEVWGTPDTFRGAGIINQPDFLIGGPLARGREGDVLLQNDKIRLIIQKPGRSAGIGTFGGNLIDADRFRPSSEPGQDQFGIMFPLINLSWTSNYQNLEIINADFANGPVVLRATGALDVYDYIQTNIIVLFTKVFVGPDLFFPDRFNDIFNPFDNIKDLRDLVGVVVTDYILPKDSDYLIIETKFQNDGEDPVKMPVGDWVNGSGTLETFSPGKGFVDKAQLDDTSALVYSAIQSGVSVSYGYFFNPIQFSQEDGSLSGSAALNTAGMNPIVLGEPQLLQLLPLGTGPQEPTINFSIDHGVRTVTRYFVVGTGDIASVLEGGYKALGVSKVRLTGKVTDGGGQPVQGARVIVLDDGNPVNVAFSQPDGKFSMDISSGADAKAKLFGSGKYTIQVYQEGYYQNGGTRAGKCNGGSFDPSAATFSGVQCQLGQSGVVTASVKVDGAPGPARLTIVGFDPSPTHPYGLAEGFGTYRDINFEERPYGVVDVLYIDPHGDIYPQGNPRMVGRNSFRLEPGEYEFFFSRGLEYSIDSQRVTVGAGGSVSVHGDIRKVLDTTGYVSGDFHVHAINSPDSPYPNENRIRAAMAEGLDVLVATDHDYVTDNAPLIQSLGYDGYLAGFPGDEITPLNYGHMVTWPLTPEPSRPDNGAYDYTYVPGDDVLNPGHDLVQSPAEIISGVDQANPGTQVFSVAHITHPAFGNFALSRLVTSPAFGVEPFSTYADPVLFRLEANSNSSGGHQAPFPLGTNAMFTLNFTSVGLTISTEPDLFAHLIETALPTYFNLLNLGKICSATSDSDTHSQIREPVGIPRNFVASSVDPRDGIGTFNEVSEEELAVNVNQGKVVVTNGIFIRAKLTSSSDPSGVTVGGTLAGTGDVSLDLEITSNEYFDWDTVEIYANTEPTPAKDDLSGLTDLSSEQFHTGSHEHLPRYLMTPLVSFHKGIGGEFDLNQTVANGVRKAVLSRDFHFNEDTWIVILVKGSDAVRSTFPYVTKGAKVADGEKDPSAPTAPANFLDTLDSKPEKIGGIRAFAFTNPMFVDVDGNGFESLYIRDGTSPLAH